MVGPRGHGTRDPPIGASGVGIEQFVGGTSARPAHVTTVTIDELLLGDDADSWRSAGFDVTDDVVVIGSVRVRCTGDGASPDRWSLRPLDDPLPDSVDGIATTSSTADLPEPVEHPNHVVGMDHVVLRSPDLDRTTRAIEALGVDCRRVRDTAIGDTPIQQRFFRFGPTIIELVGPPTPTGDDPATIWGCACTVDDIDAAASALGAACSPPKPAVQPGRRIATVRTRDLGISVTIALMTPHVR